MMNGIEETILREIQLPDSCYELAKNRYEALASFLGEADSEIANLEPQIQPQGSFRMGTAILPQDRSKKEYDLDLTLICKKAVPMMFSQREFKEKVMRVISKYARSHGMKEVEDKRKCCTLHYREQNGICFHEDIVPATPRPVGADASRIFASKHPNLTIKQPEEALCEIFITDKHREDFDKVVPEWQTSNPEGLAQWLESRCESEIHSDFEIKEGIDIVPLPFWKRKTKLQGAIQLMKWHRDFMFQNNGKGKPASIIITVLAAKCYKNEQPISELLVAMHNKLKNDNYEVRNPVDGNEKFTDKWTDPKHSSENLKENFLEWLDKARMVFEILESDGIRREDAEFIVGHNLNLKGVEFPSLPSYPKNQTRTKVEECIKRWCN